MKPPRLSGDGIRAALARTAEADRAVRTLLASLDNGRHDVAVFATGGYGRGDLTLHSDLDLLIVYRGDPTRHEVLIRSLVQGLWDLGLTPAQTLLPLEDVDDSLLAIPDRASTVLECRRLWGDDRLVDAFERRVNERFTREVWERFVEAKRSEFQSRRDKYGRVTRVIEPHLKAQAGGLRDLHHVLWLEQARAALEDRWTLRRRRGSEVRGFVRRLRRAGLFTRREARELRDAYDLLLRLREALRERVGRGEDILPVAEQVPVGQVLGVEGGEGTVMREVMRAAYGAMTKLQRFADEFGALLSDYGMRVPRDARQLHPEMPGARCAGGRVYLTADCVTRVSRDPGVLLRLLDLCHDGGVELAGRSRHDLRRALHRRAGPAPAAWAEPLKRWLERREGIGSRMRSLDELDAIVLWLPEWAEIAGLTTGSYYHQYTVDEHTLRALERLDDLPADGPKGLAASLWEDHPRRPVVALAVIFHDIAKGRRGEHSPEGARIVRQALGRLGWERWATPVAKLVRIHLRMEQVAFRRDHKDPGVISGFASLVGDEETLRDLYLLTVCDLSAVASRVWSSWKGLLLAELYLEAREWFRRGGERRISVDQEVRRVAPFVGGGEEAEARAREFLEGMRGEYRHSVPAEEIADHMQAVERVLAGREGFHWDLRNGPGHVVLTLITRDRMGLLAQAAGVLVTQGVGIREARIFTRSDGIVVDRFRAEDIQQNGVPLEERLQQIPRIWEELERGESSLQQRLARWARSRRLDRAPVGRVDAEVAITPAADGYLVDVSGRDSVGLLHRLCTVLAENGLDVRAARVSGRLDGIMDSFLVRDRQGALDTPEGRQRLIEDVQRAVDEPE